MRDNLAGRCTKLPVACDFSSDTMLRFIAWIVKTMNIYIEFATRRNFENSEKERYRKMRIFVHSKHFMIIIIEKKKKLVLIMKWVNWRSQTSSLERMLCWLCLKKWGLIICSFFSHGLQKKDLSTHFFFFFLKNPFGRNSIYSWC